MVEKYKIKMFLWDQFILPIYWFFDRENVQAIAVSLLIINTLAFKSLFLFWGCILIIFIISLINLIKYWKSGEYINNYRKHNYPNYKKTIKEIKREKIIEEPINEIIEEESKEELNSLEQKKDEEIK